MAYFGILFWAIVAVGVFTFLGWSTNTLLAQKKAWSEFGEKYKLNVRRGKFLEPVSVTGFLNGRRINIYGELEKTNNERTQRIYTHVEVYLNAPLPFLALLSKKQLPDILGDVSLPETFKISSPDWFSPAVSMTSDSYAMANWMTPSRMRAFKGFMDMAGRGTETLFYGDDSMAFLLWRSEDPLRDPRKLNALVQKLYGFAKDIDSSGLVTAPAPPAA